MATVILTDREQALLPAVGSAMLLRGRELAGDGRQLSAQVDVGQGRVTGTVGAYEINLTLLHADGRVTGVEGWCSCGLAVPCPHAVAVLLAASGASPAAVVTPVTPVAGAPVTPVAGTPVTPVAGAPVTPVVIESPRRPAAWEGVLTAALSERPARTARRAGTRQPATPAPQEPPLALQFEGSVAPEGRIALRPVVRGRSGAWVRQGITWATLQYADYYYRHFPSDQVQLLQDQVQLLQELSQLPGTTTNGYGDKAITLEAVTSRRVWDILLEAQERGLPLVMSGRAAEPVRVSAEPALPRLVVARVDGELVLQARFELATGPVPSPCRMLGATPHGVVWSAAGPDGPFHLARLATSLPPLFVRLAERGPLRIPAADEQHFLEGYYPQLTRRLEVVCPDASVELPAAQPPRLDLTVTGHGGHRVEVTWGWTYQVGAAHRTEALHPPVGAAPGRDVAAEARVLTDVCDLLGQVPGLVDRSSGRPFPVSGAQLDGVDTARFMAEVVSELQAHPQVEVRLALDDQTSDYRQADEPPVVRFEADGTAGASTGFGSQDWFDLAVTVTVDGHHVPFEPLFTALAQEESSLVLDNGVYFRLDRPELAELARLIAESRELLDAPPATMRLTRYHAALWDDLERLGEITGQVDAWRQSVRSLAAVDALPEHKVPADLQATLRPYQERGFGWLARLWSLGLGGILADDMGLGKTMQVLSLVLHAREQGRTDRPFLVVAPTSVVGVWAREAARFAPGLTVATVTQTAARRGHDVATAIEGADLVITSYTLFRLEFEGYRSRQWAALVLDEAQNVKNHQSAGYRCARQLPAEIKIAVTGTPMENNLLELWSLLSITAPGLFPRADRFSQYYRTPIERDHDSERLAQLRRRIRPLLLRRTKDQVAADLPDRQEQVVEIELHPRHRTAYSRYLQRERQKVLGLLGDFQRNRFEIFRSLTLLRQASLDVSLVDPDLAGVPATKLDALLEQLEDLVAEGHRVLVFSQFTRFLGRARDRLDAAGIDYCYLDGRTRNRPRVISKFREGDAPVFLISLKAGGSGLTLTEADYVVILDPWWNPATEAQAVDRAHRIGQTRKVMVYRMVAKDTIEEKVMALKERKAALTASVLAGDDFASAAVTADDIRELLR